MLLYLPLPQQAIADLLFNPPLSVHRVLIVDFLPEFDAELVHLLQIGYSFSEIVFNACLLLLEMQVFVVVEGGLVLEVGELIDLELEVREELVVFQL